MTWKCWDSWFWAPTMLLTWGGRKASFLFWFHCWWKPFWEHTSTFFVLFFFLLSCKITRQSKPFLRVLFPLSFSCSYPPVHSGEEQRYPYVLGWYLCIWKDNCCTCGMNVLPKEMNKNTVTSFQVCCWMLVVVFLKRTTSLKWTNLWSLACL